MLSLTAVPVWHHRGLNQPPVAPASRGRAHALRQRFGASSRARLPPCATADPQGETSSTSGASAVAGSGSSATAAGGAAAAVGGGRALLQASEPIDRLRYQAMMLFDHFDADKDGEAARARGACFLCVRCLCACQLTRAALCPNPPWQHTTHSPHPPKNHPGSLIAPEMDAFFAYCRRKVLWSPGLAETLQQVQDALLSALPAGAAWTRDQFVRLIRTQVGGLSLLLFWFLLLFWGVVSGRVGLPASNAWESERARGGTHTGCRRAARAVHAYVRCPRAPAFFEPETPIFDD